MQVFTALWPGISVCPTTSPTDISNLRTENSYDIFEVDNFWLSGKMLIFVIILCLVAAESAAALYLRRTNRSSEMLERQAVSGAENFRPLAEPSKEELLTEQN